MITGTSRGVGYELAKKFVQSLNKDKLIIVKGTFAKGVKTSAGVKKVKKTANKGKKGGFNTKQCDPVPRTRFGYFIHFKSSIYSELST